jgi:hypothetical protein
VLAATRMPCMKRARVSGRINTFGSAHIPGHLRPAWVFCWAAAPALRK